MRFFYSLIFLFATTAAGQDRVRQTNPTPPRTKPASNVVERMLLSFQVPTEPEKYRFLATTKFDGKDRGSTEIEAWGFDWRGHRFRIGTIAPGTEITMEFFKHKGKALYYALPYTAIQPTNAVTGVQPKWAWISGRNIEVHRK